MKGFEKFIPPARRKSHKSLISIWKRGQIAFNAVFRNRFGLETFAFAVLFFNKKTEQIGIIFTNDANEEGAMKIYKSKNGAYWLNAKVFCDYHKISFPGQLRNFEFDEKENFCVISL